MPFSRKQKTALAVALSLALVACTGVVAFAPWTQCVSTGSAKDAITAECMKTITGGAGQFSLSACMAAAPASIGGSEDYTLILQEIAAQLPSDEYLDGDELCRKGISYWSKLDASTSSHWREAIAVRWLQLSAFVAAIAGAACASRAAYKAAWALAAGAEVLLGGAGVLIIAVLASPDSPITVSLVFLGVSLFLVAPLAIAAGRVAEVVVAKEEDVASDAAALGAVPADPADQVVVVELPAVVGVRKTDVVAIV